MSENKDSYNRLCDSNTANTEENKNSQKNPPVLSNNQTDDINGYDRLAQSNGQYNNLFKNRFEIILDPGWDQGINGKTM